MDVSETGGQLEENKVKELDITESFQSADLRAKKF